MAQTYTWASVLNLMNKAIPRSTEASSAASLCNLAQNLVWMAADWTQTIATLPPFYLLSGEQDYTAPRITIPTDFNGLRIVTYADINTDPVWKSEQLLVIQDLKRTHSQGMPSCISYAKDIQGFRVFPRVPSGLAGGRYIVEGTYKKLPTKITPSEYTNTYLFLDDIYLQVFIAALKWASLFIDSSPQEEAAKQKAEQIISEAASDLGLNLGDYSLAPRENLQNAGGYGSLLGTNGIWY